jgi:hypothetical protein
VLIIYYEPVSDGLDVGSCVSDADALWPGLGSSWTHAFAWPQPERDDASDYFQQDSGGVPERISSEQGWLARRAAAIKLVSKVGQGFGR